MMTLRKAILSCLAVLVLSSIVFATSNGGWMAKVPARDRDKANPYHDQPEAVAAGRRIFLEHCAQCHGKDAQGTDKRPSLRTARVQQEATEGDLHWLLVHGSMANGMPSWSKLGDPQIWQVITYVRSLHQEPQPNEPQAPQ